MIVKIKTYKRPVYGRLLNYMLHDKDRLYDSRKRSFIIKHNIKGDDVPQWEKQFKENETHRKIYRKNSIKLTHEIISFHKDDAKNITLDKLEDIAREYILRRGEKGMYIAVPHIDKEHYHIHICASGLEYRSGKTMRMSRVDFQTLKKDIQQYQRDKFPELTKSTVNHATDPAKTKESKPTDREYQYKRRTGRETDKEQVIAMLKTCYKAASSKEDFFLLIKETSLQTYIRGGKISGVIYKGNKFRINRLGFTEDRLLELNRSVTRKEEMEVVLTTKKRGNDRSEKSDFDRTI